MQLCKGTTPAHHKDTVQGSARAAPTDVGPHVDAVFNWNAVPHSDVAPHDDVER